MNSETLVAALRAGDEASIVAVLCALGDECFVYQAPDGEPVTIAGARLGSTVVISDGARFELHGHPADDVAHACFVRLRAQGENLGWQDTGLTPELMSEGMDRLVGTTAPVGDRVPDGLIDLDGRMAEVRFV